MMVQSEVFSAGQGFAKKTATPLPCFTTVDRQPMFYTFGRPVHQSGSKTRSIEFLEIRNFTSSAPKRQKLTSVTKIDIESLYSSHKEKSLHMVYCKNI